MPNEENRSKPIAYFRVLGEKYLRILRVLGSFFISFYRNLHSKIFQKYSPSLLLFIAYGRSLLNDTIDFISIFIDNIKKIIFMRHLFVAEVGQAIGLYIRRKTNCNYSG